MSFALMKYCGHTCIRKIDAQSCYIALVRFVCYYWVRSRLRACKEKCTVFGEFIHSIILKLEEC